MPVIPAIRTSALSVFIALLLPAAALADAWTVDPADGNKACGGQDKVCPTIQSAVEAAAGEDVITVLKGTYAEAVTIGKRVDIKGENASDVKLVGAGTGDVVNITGDGVALRSLTIETPANAGSAVNVASGADAATIDGVVAQRLNASNVNDATISVAGTASVLKSFVVQQVGATGTPAIASSGTGTKVEDSIAISAVGPAAVFSAGEANQVMRSTLVSSHAASDAVQVLSAAAGNRKLVADSSYLIGGKDAAGVLARSSESDAGDIVVEAKHITTSGSAKGIVLDSTDADAGALADAPVGNITATVTNSIVHGTSSANHFEQSLPILTGPDNSAKLTFNTSDIGQTSGNGEIVKNNTTSTEDSKLFGKNLRLRPDAPVVDKGADGVSASTTDIDGDPRKNGAAPDLGADEFVNRPPVAAFGVTQDKPKEGEQVGFISGSTDPEQDAGGGIVEYRWDFGDGTKETTTVGGVAHTYATKGTYNVTLQVVDRQGAASAVSAPKTITVVDGQPPVVEITAPTEGARLKLTRRTGRRRKLTAIPLTILGTVRDQSGVASVEVALVQTGRKRRRARRSQTTTPTCRHYSGRVLARKACDNEIWLKAKVTGTAWQLRTRRRLRLPPGRWEIRARSTDNSGLMSKPFSVADKSLVHFRVR